MIASDDSPEQRLVTAHNMLRLNALLDSAPNDTSPHRLFGTVDDDYWLWLHKEGCRKSAVLRKILPGMPDDKWQFQTVGVVGDAALQMGLNSSRAFKQIYEGLAGDFSECSSVLDFGCGWGRVIRFFLKDIAPSKLFGIDVVKQNIEFCQESFKWGHFFQNNPFPSTSFSDEKFQLIYALSVFSHLLEDAHLKWLEEFSRILKPGGVFIATTWGREFITHCEKSRDQKELIGYVVKECRILAPDRTASARVSDRA